MVLYDSGLVCVPKHLCLILFAVLDRECCCLWHTRGLLPRSLSLCVLWGLNAKFVFLVLFVDIGRDSELVVNGLWLLKGVFHTDPRLPGEVALNS